MNKCWWIFVLLTCLLVHKHMRSASLALVDGTLAESAAGSGLLESIGGGGHVVLAGDVGWLLTVQNK